MMGEPNNNEQEGVTPDRLRYEADAMYAAVQGEEYGDTFHAFNWADKPHRVLYDAINLIRDSASEIDRLQRENAELRERLDIGPHGEDAIDVAESAADHLRHRAEAAEAEVKRLQTELALSKPLYSRRQIEARVKSLEEALKPFAKFGGELAELKQRVFLQILVCPEGDDHADNYRSNFVRARDTLASTGGEHHGN